MAEDQLSLPDRAFEVANYAGQERIAIEQALAVAAQMPKEQENGEINHDREFAYESIARSIVRTGDFTRAFDIIQSHDVPSEQIDIKDSLTGCIAQEQTKRGDFQSAIAYYHSLADKYTYGYGVAAGIAQGIAESGDIAGAVQFSSSLKDVGERIEAKCSIATVEGRDSPLWKEVEQEVDSYDDRNHEDQQYPISKNEVIMRFVSARANVGDIGKARIALETITDPGCQLELRLTIARAEGPDSPQWDKLIHAFRGPEEPSDPLSQWLRGNAHQQQRIAEAMAKAGSEARAREFAYSDDEHDNASNSIRVSLAVGDIDRARATLAEYARMPGARQLMAEHRSIDIIKAELEAGRTAQVDADIAQITDPQYKVLAILAKVDHAAEEIETLGIFPEAGTDSLPTLNPNISTQQAKNIGAYTIEHWRQFKDYDGATFSKLAHGAAEIAHAYMSDEERVAFIRTLGDEFRRFRDQGMFSDGKHQIVLKHLSEAMVEVGDAGTTSAMLETLYANMGEATGIRLIKSMIEGGNAKAAAAGIDVLANPDTPDHVYQYLLNKLAVTGYVDRQLPATIIERQAQGFPAVASRKVLQTLYGRFGVQLDSDLLGWVTEKMYGNDFGVDYPERSPEPKAFSPSTVMEGLDAKLDKVADLVEESLEKFETLSQPELFKLLSNDSDSRTLYFMLYGGRTNYSLIQHYNLTKFSQAVAKGAEIERHIDPTHIDTKLWEHAPDGWQKAMQLRMRPSDNLVWQLEVGNSSHELRRQARQELRDVLGTQLNWLLGSGTMAKNFGELPDVIPPLDTKLSKRVNALLGDRVVAILTGKEQDITIGDFEKLKNNMLSQIRQTRQAARKQKDLSATAWADILNQAQAEDPVLAMRHILALVSRDPSRSLHPQGADAEWLGHVTGLSTVIRNSQRTGTDNRTLTVRYLDGKGDFTELLRFADGAQCCFTSEDTAGIEMDPAGEWRMRINRDPHWFVFSIEDTPPDAGKRVSTGFVFGSLAEVDSLPALAINGIYMQRKTDSAANAILDDIVTRFAKPLGVRSVVVAAKHGGNFNIDRTKWEPAGGHSLLRPRAILDTDGYPETAIYDDLGTRVNVADTLDNQSWRQIIR